MDKILIEKQKQFIPEYWLEHLNEKIGKIKAIQKDLGKDGVSFGFITDIHWNDNEKHSAAIMKKVLTECDIPFFINGGDVAQREEIGKELEEWRAAFYDVEKKCILALGNHDSQKPDTDDEKFHKFDIGYDACYDNRRLSENKMYRYADDEEKKVRYIALNTHVHRSDNDGRWIKEVGVSQMQIHWLVKDALKLPEKDWTVVICSHEAFGERCYNLDVICEILSAFKNRTSCQISRTYEECPSYDIEINADFEKGGGEVAIWLSGHGHKDTEKVVGGILAVRTINDSMHNVQSSPFTHERGTITEQAFDIFTIDKKNHKIYATRIGCGLDREFKY